MGKYIPSKQALIAGLIVTFIGLYIYNKSATVRKITGAAA